MSQHYENHPGMDPQYHPGPFPTIKMQILDAERRFLKTKVLVAAAEVYATGYRTMSVRGLTDYHKQNLN